VKESEIQKQILDYLKLKLLRCLQAPERGDHEAPNGSYIPLAFGEKGISDIIGCSPQGVFRGEAARRKAVARTVGIYRERKKE
jgi:hypothetical protein